MIRAALAALALVLAAPTAAAQSRDDTAAARADWERGRALAGEGDWAGARDAFEASLARVERASTLISLATAEVHLGHGRAALAALDRLAEIAHPRRDRAHLRAAEQLRPRAEELAAAEAAAEAAPPPAPEPEPVAPPPPEPEPAAPEGANDDFLAALAPGLAIAGIGVLTFIGAAATFAVRQDALAARDARCPGAVCPTGADREAALAHHADAATLTDATNALLAVGLVAVAAGGALVAVGLAMGPSEAAPVSVAPVVGPSGAGLHVAGRF